MARPWCGWTSLATALTSLVLVVRASVGQERVFTDSPPRDLQQFAAGTPRLPDPLPPLPLDASAEYVAQPPGVPQSATTGPLDPGFLRRPLDAETLSPQLPREAFEYGSMLQQWRDAPLGFTGPSGVMPTEIQESSHFVPVEDRWREGLPEWDRYGRDFPLDQDYPYELGRFIDPYNQNVLKGDYPIIGQHTFFNFTLTSRMLQEGRQVPTATTPFESTVDPDQAEFFGDPEQYFYNNNFLFALELFHGNAAFKPADWRIRLTPVVNANYLDTEELAIVNPDVRKGTTRDDHYGALEEWFAELKLADLGPDYDFVSVRGGSQPFVSDFRGFLFADINRSVRLFGTQNANRNQFNLIWFDQLEKDTNSELNTLTEDRHQNVFIANYFTQDFIWPGYTFMVNFHYNRDQPDFLFDRNNFLVRPDPAGVFTPHEVEAYYLGFHGDGHIERFNITHAFYWALGHDSLNPIAGRKQDINAQFAAIELSYDRDYVRFRTSFLWSSGDDNVFDGQAEGFDTILDDPNFSGGEFTYWQRQSIRLFGVNVTQRKSIVPDLRSSKIQGQSNFVNPGLFLANVGFDVDVTPKLRLVQNTNYLWFENTEVLERFTFQDDIQREIGVDLSFGFEYRPLLSNNVIFTTGFAFLFPGRGTQDLFSTINGKSETMFSHFVEMDLVY